MKSYLLLLLSTFVSCGLFVRVPKFDEIPISERHVTEPVIFCHFYESRGEVLCEALVLFPNGDVIGHTRGINLDSGFKFSSYDDLYDENSYSAHWGKYWFRNDSLYYDFAQFWNMGGSVHHPILSRKTYFNGDTITVMPQFTQSCIPAQHFRANDTLIYVRVDYLDILNIDPSKAWINRR
jgi:hypothetical protein